MRQKQTQTSGMNDPLRASKDSLAGFPLMQHPQSGVPYEEGAPMPKNMFPVSPHSAVYPKELPEGAEPLKITPLQRTLYQAQQAGEDTSAFSVYPVT